MKKISVNISPLPANQRIEIIDILRGFAIFGILFVNIWFFSHQFIYYSKLPEMYPLLHHKVSYYLTLFLFEGKFYSLFSFLFGLGFAIQFKRFSSHEGSFNYFYLKRMFLLFLIGICHAVFLFYGDILIIYALLGIVLLLLFMGHLSYLSQPG